MIETVRDNERELAVLKLLQDDESVPQRELARKSGMSLGMTNAVLKRLVHKGYVTARKVKGRHMAYAVTPAGVHEIATRTYRYFRNTMRSVAEYKQAIDALIAEIEQAGYRHVVLRGRSDVDFLIEYACANSGIGYTRRKHRVDPAAEGAETDGSETVHIIGEREPAASVAGGDSIHLWQAILERGRG